MNQNYTIVVVRPIFHDDANEMHKYFYEHGFSDMIMEVYHDYLFLKFDSQKRAQMFVDTFNGQTVNKCKLDAYLKPPANEPPLRSHDYPDQSPRTRQSPSTDNYRDSYARDPSPPPYARDPPPPYRSKGPSYQDYPDRDYPPRDYPSYNSRDQGYGGMSRDKDYIPRDKDYIPRRDKPMPSRSDMREKEYMSRESPRLRDDWGRNDRNDRIDRNDRYDRSRMDIDDGPDDLRETRTIRVTGLPDDMQEKDLFNLFYESGFIRHVEIRGADGFIQFDTPMDASRAISDMDGYQIIKGRLSFRVDPYPDIPMGLPQICVPLYLIEKDGTISPPKTDAQ